MRGLAGKDPGVELIDERTSGCEIRPIELGSVQVYLVGFGMV